MNRLTGKDSRTGLTTLVGCEGVYDSLSVSNALAVENALSRLSAYEDTGLSPEEIKLNMDGLDEYRKAEAEGRLVIPPCKVGDKFYLVNKLCYKFPASCDYDWKCSDCEENKPFIAEYSVKTLSQAVAIRDAVGKTIFFTCEEAEKALERLRDVDD